MQSIASASDEVEERHPAGDTSDPADTAWQPSSFDAMGRRAWGFIGIAVVTVAIYAVLAALSGLVVPLVIAVVLGMLFVPLVDKLAQWMGRQLAAIIVMLGLAVVALGSGALAISGVVDQGPQISKEITAGINAVADWLTEQGVDLSSSGNLATGIQSVFSDSLSGASGYFSSVFFGSRRLPGRLIRRNLHPVLHLDGLGYVQFGSAPTWERPQTSAERYCMTLPGRFAGTSPRSP